MFSAFGVTLRGPMILGWIDGTQFFDLGLTAKLLGEYLDIIEATPISIILPMKKLSIIPPSPLYCPDVLLTDPFFLSR